MKAKQCGQTMWNQTELAQMCSALAVGARCPANVDPCKAHYSDGIYPEHVPDLGQISADPGNAAVGAPT